MGWRVEEEGGSECRPVMGRIRVGPWGEITVRESGLTSLGCLRTRPSEQLAWEAEQMTAALLLVRPLADSARQPRTSIVQVGRLPHRVPRGALERLERHKPKGFRAVLRGLGSSNAPRLPGKAISMAKGGRWTGTVGKAGECNAHMPHFPRLSRHWRAGCGESCKSGSGGGGWKSARQRVTRWPPTSLTPKRASHGLRS